MKMGIDIVALHSNNITQRASKMMLRQHINDFAVSDLLIV